MLSTLSLIASFEKEGFLMANHKSAAKRARQSIRKNEINSNRKSTVRTFEKKLRAAIADNKGEEATSLLKTYTKAIYKAAKNKVFHKNQASRKVSRLASQVSSLNS